MNSYVDLTRSKAQIYSHGFVPKFDAMNYQLIKKSTSGPGDISLIGLLWRHKASCNLVNICSGNDLLPDGTKILSEPILTYHLWGYLAFTRGYFYREWYIEKISVDETCLKYTSSKSHHIRCQWVKAVSSNTHPSCHPSVLAGTWDYAICLRIRHELTILGPFQNHTRRFIVGYRCLQSLGNLAGVSAALLLNCLPLFKVIWTINTQSRELETSRDLMMMHLIKHWNSLMTYRVVNFTSNQSQTYRPTHFQVALDKIYEKYLKRIIWNSLKQLQQIKVYHI